MVIVSTYCYPNSVSPLHFFLFPFFLSPSLSANSLPEDGRGWQISVIKDKNASFYLSNSPVLCRHRLGTVYFSFDTNCLELSMQAKGSVSKTAPTPDANCKSQVLTSSSDHWFQLGFQGPSPQVWSFARTAHKMYVLRLPEKIF